MADKETGDENLRKASFSRMATAILQSPYFNDIDGLFEEFGDDEKGLYAESQKRQKEQDELCEALSSAESVDELKGTAKELWDRSMKSLVLASDEEATWKQRVLNDDGFSVPDYGDMGGTAEDRVMTMNLMAQVQELGGAEATQALAKLGDDPLKLYNAVGLGKRVTRVPAMTEEEDKGGRETDNRKGEKALRPPMPNTKTSDDERLQIVAEILAHIITEAGQGGDKTE